MRGDFDEDEIDDDEWQCFEDTCVCTDGMCGESEADEREMSTPHYAVTVARYGEDIVTIETNCLSGRDLQPGDEQAIRWAIDSLVGFVGHPASLSSQERGAEQEKEGCQAGDV